MHMQLWPSFQVVRFTGRLCGGRDWQGIVLDASITLKVFNKHFSPLHVPLNDVLHTSITNAYVLFS